jgi:hypothetical protein
MYKKIIIILCFAAHFGFAGDLYFPLKLGNSWTFQSKFLISVKTYNETIYNQNTLGGETYFLFDNYRIYTSVAFLIDDNKVFTYINDSKYLMYDFSAEVGTSWSSPDTPKLIMGRMTLVSKSDSITTPIGTFKGCYHFKHYFDGSNYYHEWFAPNIGIVKRQTVLLSGQFEALLIGYNVTTRVKRDNSINFSKFIVYDNYPNPFNSSTKISFFSPYQTHVTITIFDCLGRFIVCLFDDNCVEGESSVIWNSSYQTSGIYLSKIRTDNFSQTKRILLQK